MKRTLFYTTLLFAAFLTSCEIEDGSDSSYYSKNYIDEYVIPDTLIAADLKKDKVYGESVYCQLIRIEGIHALGPNSGLTTITKEEEEKRHHMFDSIASFYGDTCFNDYISMDGTRVFSQYIDSMIVTSDMDFDASHPAGSNLADLLKVLVYSLGDYIMNGYNVTPPHSLSAPLYQKWIEMEETDKMLWCADGCFSLCFPKPTLSRVHNMTYTFMMKDGPTLSATKQIVFE